MMAKVDSDPPSALDPWVGAHAHDLTALAARARAALAGGALVHLDARSDNLLITPSGSVRIVDWPWACIGAPWMDVLNLRPQRQGLRPRRRRPAAARGDPRVGRERRRRRLGPGRLDRVFLVRSNPAAPTRPAHAAVVPTRTGTGVEQVAGHPAGAVRPRPGSALTSRCEPGRFRILVSRCERDRIRYSESARGDVRCAMQR